MWRSVVQCGVVQCCGVCAHVCVCVRARNAVAVSVAVVVEV